jgi:hypothetical protein
MNNNIIQNRKQNNKYLQYVYLSIALLSSCCVMTNSYIIPCANILGITCIIDFYFVKKFDMFLHHVLVLSMIYGMNNHNDITSNIKLTSIMLSAEISTIFLTINNLLENINNIKFFKNINRFMFISTFFYYRIYNYGYHLILNKDIYNILSIYSANKFILYQKYLDKKMQLVNLDDYSDELIHECSISDGNEV